MLFRNYPRTTTRFYAAAFVLILMTAWAGCDNANDAGLLPTDELTATDLGAAKSEAFAAAAPANVEIYSGFINALDKLTPIESSQILASHFAVISAYQNSQAVQEAPEECFALLNELTATLLTILKAESRPLRWIAIDGTRLGSYQAYLDYHREQGLFEKCLLALETGRRTDLAPYSKFIRAIKKLSAVESSQLLAPSAAVVLGFEGSAPVESSEPKDEYLPHVLESYLALLERLNRPLKWIAADGTEFDDYAEYGRYQWGDDFLD